MRSRTFILIVLGICLILRAGYQEIRGVTNKPWPNIPFTRRAILDMRHHGTYLYSIPVLKTQNPPLFREFMNIHWFWAGVIAVLGGWLLFKSGEE